MAYYCFMCTCCGCPQTQVKELKDFSIIAHLAGFYFLDAYDLEARVLPLITELASSALQKMSCEASSSVEICCPSELYARGGEEACLTPTGAQPITSVARLCEQLWWANGDSLGDVKARDGYVGCIEVGSEKDIEVVAAQRHWEQVLARN